jgi:hypothetical protein
MDILGLIYDALIANEFILYQAKGRIKYYEYPEAGDVKNPFIIIDPLDVPSPKDFADNTWLSNDCLLQIDVWTKNRTTTKELAENVQKVMWDIGFRQNGGIDQWDKDTGIFRDARRYRGKLYRDDLDI